MSNLDILKEELKKLGVAATIYDNVEQMEEDLLSSDDDGFEYDDTESYSDNYEFDVNDPIIVLDVESLFAENEEDIAKVSKFNDAFNQNLKRNLGLPTPFLTLEAVDNLAASGKKPDGVAKTVRALIKGTANSCSLTPKFK